MAFDLLSVPCTSCEIKRVFSSAKRLITPQASSMTDKTIEIRQLLNNWWRNDIVQPGTGDYGLQLDTDPSALH